MQTPEGALLDSALKARHPRLTVSAAARAAGISEGRWRQIVKGYASAGRGITIPAIAPPETLARMAEVVGISAEQLREVDREDAAAWMRGEGGAGPDLGRIDPAQRVALAIGEVNSAQYLTDYEKSLIEVILRHEGLRVDGDK